MKLGRWGVLIAGSAALLLGIALSGLSSAGARSASQASSEQPIATVTVDATSNNPAPATSASLTAGIKYRLVVSGSATAPPSGATPGNTYDALYCVSGTGCPTRTAVLDVGTASAPGYPQPDQPVDAFQQPAPNTGCVNETQCTGGLPYDSSHVYTATFFPPATGPVTFGTDPQFKVHSGYFISGSFTIKIYQAELAVVASSPVRKVDAQLGQGSWQPVFAGLQLHAGDRVHTGWKSSVKLTFPDGSTLLVKPMSLVLIEGLERKPDGGLKVRVSLRLGEVSAEVNKHAVAASDFQVRTPTTTASVRGTKFSVYYDGTNTIVSVTEHKVAVTPLHGPTVTVPAGKEVASTASKVGPLSPIGKAGAPPGSVGPARALVILTNGVSHGIAACKADIYSTTLKPAAHGWNANLQLVGHAHGTANWTIAGTTLKTANALAQRIAHGCPGGTLAPSWTGSWHTSAGTMHLLQKGSQVSGTFAACQGKAKISGKASGIALDGTWSEPCIAKSGRIHFVFSADGNSFTGKYGSGTARPSAPWNGKRA